MDDEEIERDGSQRPKVVDKRISARRAAGETIGETPPGASARETRVRSSEGGNGSTPTSSEGRTAFEESRSHHPAGGADTSAEPALSDAASAPPTSAPSEVWTPEQEAEARRMIEEIAMTPSLEWVVQAAVSLANVAGTKIEAGAAADAQLAIDALAGMINGVGARLGGAEQPLRQTLAQLQLAYAQTVGGVAPPPPDPQS